MAHDTATANDGSTTVHRENNDENDDDLLLNSLTLDCLVDVKDRMWPGMNKQGGIARVKGIDRAARTVNLHYVVDRRKEKNVSIEYITLAPQYDTVRQPQQSSTSTTAMDPQQRQASNLRDRSILLGRCKRCGSLRTDCGSCDWIEEERRHYDHREKEDRNSTTTKNTHDNQQISSVKSSHTTRKRSNGSNHPQLPKENKSANDDELLDLSSDDELEQLIQEHLRRFKRFQRLRSRQDRQWHDYVKDLQEEEAEAIANAQKNSSEDEDGIPESLFNKRNNRLKRPRRILESSESESDDDRVTISSDAQNRAAVVVDQYDLASDEENLPLRQLLCRWDGNRNRVDKLKEKYHKSFDNKSYEDSATRMLERSRKRKLSQNVSLSRSQRSSLGTSAQAPALASLPENEVRRKNRNDSGRVPQKSINLVPDRTKKDTQEKMASDVESGTIEMSQKDFLPTEGEENDNDWDEQDRTLNQEGNALASQNAESSNADHADEEEDPYSLLAQRNIRTATATVTSSIGEDLQDFIQPEGEEVADNLPQDTVDRATLIPYRELPHFFDHEAKNIEDELLPDAKLKVAKLEQRINKWKQRQNNFELNQELSTINDDSRQALVQACDEILADLRASLIRDGVDQCRSALRQLLCDERYRRERRKFSKEQRKIMRRERGMLTVVRDAKMEELENATEALVRKIRNASRTLGSVAEEQDMAGQYSSSDGGANGYLTDDNEGSPSDHQSEDEVVLIDLGKSSNRTDMKASDDIIVTDQRGSPAWDRHHYARRVRPQSSQVQESGSANHEISQRPRKRSKKTGGKRPARASASQNILRFSSLNLSDQSKRASVSRNGQCDTVTRTQRHLLQPADSMDSSNVENQKTKVRHDETSPFSRDSTNKDNGTMLASNDCTKRANKNTSFKSRRVTLQPFHNNAVISRGSSRQLHKNPETCFEAPQLEELLGRGKLRCELPIQRRASGMEGGSEASRLDSHRPIADKMQAFLDANADCLNEMDEDDEDFPVGHRRQCGRSSDTISKRFSRGREHPFYVTNAAEDALLEKEHSRGGTVGDDEESYTFVVESTDAAFSDRFTSMSPEHIIGRLKVQRNSPLRPSVETSEISAHRSDRPLSSMCESLLKVCPVRSSRSFVSTLRATTVQSIAQTAALDTENCHTVAVDVFQTFLKVFQTHGTPLLQELVSLGNNARLQSHIALLTETIKLMESCLSSPLSVDDGLIYRVFSRPCQSKIIKFLILQLVDCVYSLFLPHAWALTLDDNRRLATMNALIPLRDALGRITIILHDDKPMSLSEAVCSCIVNQLESQKWRIVDSPTKHAFVSSVDPEAWKKFLQTGESLQKASETRISSFNNHLPQREIDTLWGVLAFFAEADSFLADGKADVCFRLTAKVFSLGSLKAGKDNAASDYLLPPSNDQLVACSKELNYIASLLNAGAMDSLPKSDDRLVEMINKSLHLQADSYGLNESSRRAIYPGITEGKREMKKVRALWNSFGGDADDVSVPTTCGIEATQLLKLTDDSVELYCGQPALLPSSLVVRECLSLLFFWVQNIPGKKARLNRLLTATRSLVQASLSKATEIEGQNIEDGKTQSEPDLFALAFPSTSKTVNSLNRKTLLYREAAAYQLIVSNIAIRFRVEKMGIDHVSGVQNVKEIAEQVWEMQADNAMRQRQKGVDSRAAKYTGDDYRLYTTGKTLAFLAHTFLGVPAWKGDCLNGQPILSVDIWAYDSSSEGVLNFLTSCIITCIDCLCDVNGSIEVQACLFTYLASIYRHAYRICAPGTSQLGFLMPSIRYIGNTSTTMLAHTFQRSFQVMTGADDCGAQYDVCFRSALAALRGAVSLASCCIAGQATSVNEEHTAPLEDQRRFPNDGEDLFNSIDDEAFAAIDLDAIGANNVQQDNEQDGEGISSLFRFLSEALQSSRPSQRYAIERRQDTQASSGTWDMDMSVRGKTLIANHSRYVCACLAVLGANKHKVVSGLLRSFLDLSGNSVDSWSQDDLEYHSRLLQLFSAELCSHAYKRLPKRSEVLREHSHRILLNLIAALLDANVLDKFPTCNLDRLKENSGKYGEEKELSRLMAMNDCIGVPHRRRNTGFKKSRHAGEEVWQFCFEFGAVLASHKAGDGDANCHDVIGPALSTLLVQYDPGSYEEDTLQLFSMEKECLKRIGALAAVIVYVSELANKHSSTSIYEMVFAEILGKSSRQLLAISRKMYIMELTGESNDDSARHRRSKMIELLTNVAELHITLICLGLRKCPHQLSPGFISLVSYTKNEYLIPILREIPIDIHATLEGIDKAVCAFQRGQRPVLKSFRKATTILQTSVLRESILRRSRELLLHVSLNELSGDSLLFNAIVTAGYGNAAESDSPKTAGASLIVGASFSQTIEHKNSQSSHNASPLQTSIDEYMGRKYPLDEREARGLRTMKRKALTDSVLPRIKNTNTGLQVKKGLFRFVQNLIEADNLFWNFGQSFEKAGLLFLRDLVHGLSLTLRSCLSSPHAVANDVVATIFSCARVTAVSPTFGYLNGGRKEGPVVQWCQPTSESYTGGAATQEELIRSFLWLVFMWLKAVAHTLIDQSTAGLERLQTFRNKLDNMDKNTLPWPPSTRPNSLDESQLAELQKHLFADTRKAPDTIVNIYAKNRESRSGSAINQDVLMENWTPETKVRRSAKEFIAELIPFC